MISNLRKYKKIKLLNQFDKKTIMKTDKLQLLIDNKLDTNDRSKLINEIKNSPELKQELAILMNIREIGRQKEKTIIDLNKSKSKHSAIAKFSLAEIRRAAFGQNKANDELTSLPIKDQTLDEFLNDDTLES